MQELLELYPQLAQVQPSVQEAVREGRAQWLSAPAGMVLFDQGAPCQGFPLVLCGAVRVQRHSEDGRQLELYRVEPGELCLASSACLFQGVTLSGQGVALAATRLLMVSPELFDDWMISEGFRRLVMGLFAQRMVELSALVDALAFRRLDARLAAALLGHGQVIHTTHQALADSLGTVREMVSRVLARFEREGWVKLSRETIEIVDSKALRGHAI
jgi:CRP/FNR family transcriptional regulator, anaerobic regulatory protein